jgi:hypothetical protein
LKNRNSLKDYAILVTLFVNSITIISSPVEVYIGYLAIFTLLPGYFKKYTFPRSMGAIYLILILSGLFGILIGNNTFGQFIKILLGTFVSYLFYYYVILDYKKDIKYLFELYLKGAWIVTILGIVQFVSYQIGFIPGYSWSWILNKWGLIPGGAFGVRVSSIFGEPTYYAVFMSGAAFVGMYCLMFKKNYYSRTRSVLVVVFYFLTYSGNATAGIAISFFLLIFNYGFLRYGIFLIPIGLFGFKYNYDNNFEFRQRYDSVIEIFSTGKFVIGKTHGSSIVLYNNYNVAIESFLHNPFFGGGLGSHLTSFEKYSLTQDVPVYGFNLNSQDANSMGLRIISETGIFGVLLFLFILSKYYVFRRKEDELNWVVSNAILVIVALNILRQGHYFLNGFPFYIWLYYFNWKSANEITKENPIVNE